MIDRRTFVAVLANAVGAPVALAQSAAKRPIVAFISAVGRNADHVAAFEAGLRESGLEQGRHFDVVERYADGDLGKMGRQIDELAGLGPAVFVAAGDVVMRAIQERSPKVPIVVAVMANYGNVVLGGSVARPPGNITGFSNLSAELAAKRLDIFREAIPALDQVVVLVNLAMENEAPAAYRNAGDSLGIKVRLLPVQVDMDFTAALREAKSDGARGVIVYRNFMFETVRWKLVSAIVSTGMPSMFEERFFVDMGGLFSYSTNLTDLFRRSGGYTAKVLTGTSVNELPIQLPAKFEFVVNLKAALALGITVPQSVQIRADEVIE